MHSPIKIKMILMVVMVNTYPYINANVIDVGNWV